MRGARMMVFLIGLGLAGHAVAAEPSRPGLSGRWVLNERLSDAPPAGRVGPGGRVGRRGGMGGPPGEGRGEGPAGGRTRIGLPADMVLDLSSEELVVYERGRAVRHLVFGSLATPPSDSAAVIAARWEGTQLVSEFPGFRGGSLQERWELSPDGRQLTVRTSMPAGGERPATERKRVYDLRDEP